MKHVLQHFGKLTRGMTLVEMLVVLALFSVLMLAVMNSISSFYKYNAHVISQTNEVHTARRGLETLIKDMREMTYADDGSFPLVEMDQYSAGFYSDEDGDDSVEYIEYELVSSTTLMKRVFNATGSPPAYDVDGTPDEILTLSEYVQNISQGVPVFRYYNNAGALLNDPDDIADVRYIAVHIIVNINPIQDPGEFSIRSSAALRNLSENL